MSHRAIGFDVSYRTGYAVVECDGVGGFKYVNGGIVGQASTVEHRLHIYRSTFTSTWEKPTSEVVAIEQPLPGAGNTMYMIEASKRIGEIRMMAYMLRVEDYIEVHPSQMRSFVLNARFKGKEPIWAFVNEYFKGKIDHTLKDDEADAAVHALIVCGVKGWITFPEPHRQGIIQRILAQPRQRLQ